MVLISFFIFGLFNCVLVLIDLFLCFNLFVINDENIIIGNFCIIGFFFIFFVSVRLFSCGIFIFVINNCVF